MTHLSSPQIDVEIEELGEGRRRVTLFPRDPGLFIPLTTCVTHYPVALLRSFGRTLGCGELVPIVHNAIRKV